MAEFRLSIAGAIYVSKSGNNGNAGTDPDFPKLTIAGAISALPGGGSIIIGDGTWTENTLTPAQDTAFYGDGITVLNDSGSNILFQDRRNISCQNIIFNNYDFVTNASTNHAYQFDDCLFFNTKFDGTSGTARFHAFRNCKFVNCDINIRNDRTGFGYFIGIYEPDVGVDRCTLVNSVLFTANAGSGSEERGGKVRSTDSDSAVSFQPDQGSYSNFRSTVEIIGDQVYADVATLQAANPGDYDTLIDEDPLFLGDSSRFEFLVDNASPNLGSGFTGQNMGGVQRGNLQNENETEWGTSPASAGNTAFSAGGALQLTSGTDSARESLSIDLGSRKSSPIVTLNGIPDLLTNSPDFNNALINPNALTFEADWADNDAVFTGTFEPFRWNQPMRTDSGGLFTGDAGYDWDNQVDIIMRFVKIRTTIRDDYNPA